MFTNGIWELIGNLNPGKGHGGNIITIVMLEIW